MTKRTVFAIDFESTVLPSTMTRDGKITFLYRPVQVSSVDPSSEGGRYDCEVVPLGALERLCASQRTLSIGDER